MFHFNLPPNFSYLGTRRFASPWGVDRHFGNTSFWCFSYPSFKTSPSFWSSSGNGMMTPWDQTQLRRWRNLTSFLQRWWGTALTSGSVDGGMNFLWQVSPHSWPLSISTSKSIGKSGESIIFPWKLWLCFTWIGTLICKVRKKAHKLVPSLDWSNQLIFSWQPDFWPIRFRVLFSS